MQECLRKFLKENKNENGVIRVIRPINDEKLYFIIQEDEFLDNHYIILKFYDYYDLDSKMFEAYDYKEFQEKCGKIILEDLKPYITFEELTTVYDIDKQDRMYKDNAWLKGC